jgi:hypothetical protein
VGGGFALLNPLLRRPALVVEMDDGLVRPGERGDDEADPGEELSRASKNLGELRDNRARGLEAVIAVEARGRHVRDGLALAGKQTSALVRSRILLGVAKGRY